MVRCEKKTTHVVGRIFVGINAMPIHTLGFFPQVGETPKTPDSPAAPQCGVDGRSEKR